MTLPASSGRLLSLDLFRGIAVAIMVFVAFSGHLPEVVTTLNHAEWHGITFADLWFPFFVFAAGASTALSVSKRLKEGHSKRRIMVRAARRTVILFCLGLFLNWIPYFDGLRIMGVLQRIALATFFTSLIFLKFGPKGLLPSSAILILTWIGLMQIGGGSFEQGSNFASHVDRVVLQGHLYAEWGDPEGIVGTLTATATALFGALAGLVLRSRKSSDASRLIVWGMAGLALGLILNPLVPINKSLWTASFAIFTAALAVLLSGLVQLIPIGIQKWTKPLATIGGNPLISYIVVSILYAVYATYEVQGPTGPIPAYAFIVDIVLAPLGPFLGSLVFAVAHVLLIYLITKVLQVTGISIRA